MVWPVWYMTDSGLASMFAVWLWGASQVDGPPLQSRYSRSPPPSRSNAMTARLRETAICLADRFQSSLIDTTLLSCVLTAYGLAR